VHSSVPAPGGEAVDAGIRHGDIRVVALLHSVSPPVAAEGHVDRQAPAVVGAPASCDALLPRRLALLGAVPHDPVPAPRVLAGCRAAVERTRVPIVALLPRVRFPVAAGGIQRIARLPIAFVAPKSPLPHWLRRKSEDPRLYLHFRAVLAFRKTEIGACCPVRVRERRSAAAGRAADFLIERAQSGGRRIHDSREKSTARRHGDRDDDRDGPHDDQNVAFSRKQDRTHMVGNPTSPVVRAQRIFGKRDKRDL